MTNNPIDDFHNSFPMGDIKEVPKIKDITKRRLQIPDFYKDKKLLIVGDAFSHESSWLRHLGFQNITSTIKSKREIRVGEPIICDLHSLPFEDSSFDYVYCSHVLEHCVAPMIALKEIRRVLKINGEALFWMPYSDIMQKEFYHLSCFRPYVWKDLIFKSKLSLTKEEDYPPRNEYGYWVKKI